MSDLSILSCHKVSKKVVFREAVIHLFSNLDLSLLKGESVAIMGPSGSGKTSLINLLAGLDIPSDGNIYLFGEHLNGLTEDARAALRRRYIGIVFQSFHLLAGFSALENVMVPLEIQKIAAADSIARGLLEQVGMLERMHHFPATLSGGEQQRIAIARAFAARPSLLLADEPTGNLDTKTSKQIMDLLFSLNLEYGVSLVLVTHSGELSRRCDHRLHLSENGLAAIP